MTNCKFCDIAQHKTEDWIILDDEKFMAFLDINPAKQGHCLLIPKKHTEYLFDMNERLYIELLKTAKKLSEPLRKATNAKKIGLIVMGFDIPHAHIHLVPLHRSGELFDSKLFLKATPEELKEIQEKIKESLRNY